MKEASVKKRGTKDAQLREFELKDLGQDIVRSQSAVVIHPRHRQLATSLLLDPALIEKLKKKADRRGIGYQTMLKIIVHEHVDEY
jgi:predicted DNA binding CopG/RHH family protein